MNEDEILQQYLQELENGKPLRQVLAELPAEHHHLAQLIGLAARTRGATHPELNALKARDQHQRVTDGIRPTPHRRSSSARRPAWGLLSLGAAAFAVIAVLAVTSLVGLAFLFSNTQAAQAATVIDVNGIIEASSNGSTWNILSEGDQVRQGMRLRTLSSSGATLVFYDGSRTNLSDNADITLNRLGGGWNLFSGRGLQVRYTQASGVSYHSVVPLKGSSSYFEVLTPSGKATVHGTIFDVDVTSRGGARFAVSRGVVEVSQSNSLVTLTAGQASLTGQKSTPSSPTYEFTIQGQISAIAGEQWTINGISFQVGPDATDDYTFLVGDWVSVRGRILADGSYIADRVVPSSQDVVKEHFSGIVESSGTESWVISGKTVYVDANTEIDSGIRTGDPVKVSFTVRADGSWLALSIERTDDTHETEPTRTPAVQLTGTQTKPTEEGETEEPRKTRTPQASTTPEITATLATPEASPTVETSGTPEVTPTTDGTPTIEVTATPEGKRGVCSSTDRQQPEGARLAQRWGVPYSEIMGWFCQGFGFGEIDLAYELAQRSGKPVSEIFAMKAGGMGWGNIRKQLEKINPPTPQATPGPKKNPGNGNGNGGNPHHK